MKSELWVSLCFLSYFLMPKASGWAMERAGSRRREARERGHYSRMYKIDERRNAAAAAAAAAAVVSRAPMNVRSGGLIGMELKAFDTVFTATSITNNDTWAGGEYENTSYGLFCPVQSNALNGREGNRVTVKSILVQGRVYRGMQAGQANPRQPSCVQVALVQDRQTNGVVLNAEDVFAVTNPSVPGQRVLEYSRRFRVLATKVIPLYDICGINDAAATGAVTGNIVDFVFSVKLNVEVNFVNGAGAATVADLRDVSFHIIAATSDTGADYLTYNSRVRYVG